MNEEEDKQIERVDFFRNADKGVKSLSESVKEMRSKLTDKEREILDKRFSK